MIGLTTYNRWCNYYIPNLTGTLDGRAPLMGPAAARAIATTFGMIARPQELHGQRGGEIMTRRVGVALRLQRDKSAAGCELGPGQYMLWGIAR